MTIYGRLQAAYLAYLQYLRDGGARVERPPDERSGADYEAIYASSLCGCPLRNAHRFLGSAPTHPETDAEQMSSLHLMQQGVRDAEPIQEALMWKFGAGVERSIASDEYKLRGRADVVLRLDGELHVIEIKRRDPFRGKVEPKCSDVLQVMAYMRVTGITHGHILILNRYFFKLWSLHPVDGGFIVRDETGDPWNDDANTPERLNFDAVRDEIERQLHYQRMVQNGERPPIPIPDPVNDPDGWQCIIWLDKPRAYKTKDNQPGAIKRRCVYNCHFRPGEDEVAVTIDDDGRMAAAFDTSF